MKTLIALVAVLAMGACSLVGGKKDPFADAYWGESDDGRPLFCVPSRCFQMSDTDWEYFFNPDGQSDNAL